MKMRLTIDFDANESAAELREHLADALIVSRWAFCNGGSWKNVETLAMKFDDDNEQCARYEANGWVANLTLRRRDN